MKTRTYPRTSVGFTMVEMLVVIAIIGILAALLLPALTSAKKRAVRMVCVSQLRQIGVALNSFAHDHDGKFPAAYSTDGYFQNLAGYVSNPNVLVCPADDGRVPAASFPNLRNTNISYFAGMGADFSRPMSVLAGDRNLSGPGLAWTAALHHFKGNVLFADGHVEELNNGGSASAISVDPVLPTGGDPAAGDPSNPVIPLTGSPSSGNGGGNGSPQINPIGSPYIPNGNGGLPQTNSSAQTNTVPGSPFTNGPAALPNKTFVPPMPFLQTLMANQNQGSSTSTSGPAKGPPGLARKVDDNHPLPGNHPEKASIDGGDSNSEPAVVSNATGTTAGITKTSDDDLNLSPFDREFVKWFRIIFCLFYGLLLLLLLLYVVWRYLRWSEEREYRRMSSGFRR